MQLHFRRCIALIQKNIRWNPRRTILLKSNTISKVLSRRSIQKKGLITTSSNYRRCYSKCLEIYLSNREICPFSNAESRIAPRREPWHADEIGLYLSILQLQSCVHRARRLHPLGSWSLCIDFRYENWTDPVRVWTVWYRTDLAHPSAFRPIENLQYRWRLYCFDGIMYC